METKNVLESILDWFSNNLPKCDCKGKSVAFTQNYLKCYCSNVKEIRMIHTVPSKCDEWKDKSKSKISYYRTKSLKKIEVSGDVYFNLTCEEINCGKSDLVC